MSKNNPLAKIQQKRYRIKKWNEWIFTIHIAFIQYKFCLYNRKKNDEIQKEKLFDTNENCTMQMKNYRIKMKIIQCKIIVFK